MTYDGGKKHKVGDKGQRYEVRFKDGSGKESVFGWSEKLEGAESFVKGIGLHPSWHSPRIVDRECLGCAKEQVSTEGHKCVVHNTTLKNKTDSTQVFDLKEYNYISWKDLNGKKVELVACSSESENRSYEALFARDLETGIVYMVSEKIEGKTL